MSHAENSYPYTILVAGTGALYEEKLRDTFDRLNPPGLMLFDKDITRVRDLPEKSLRFSADAGTPPFQFTEQQNVVAFIATTDHLSSITALFKGGLTRFIVEKPLASNSQQAHELTKFLHVHPDVKIFPLDFYEQKALPVAIISGAVTSNDPRWERVTTIDGQPVPPDMSGKLPELIGDIVGIEVVIIEGGTFGLPDIDKRRWLIDDPIRGGVLLDLTTHALLPLRSLIELSQLRIETATRYKLSEDMLSFVRASPDDVEVYTEILLTTERNGKHIAVKMSIGKTFHDGGLWRLGVRGSKGELTMGLRTGQCLTIQPNDKPAISLKLRRGSDPYALAFEEARWFFEGKIDGTQMLADMVAAILLIDQIKEKSNEIYSFRPG